MVAASAIVAALLLVGLATLFYGPWQDLCTDYARQIVFEKRDAIFDLARERRLYFESGEYRVIRAALEKGIRFAHELTWIRLTVLYLSLKSAGGLPKNAEPQQAIERITDPALRKEVQKLVNEAYIALIVMTALKSAIWLLFGIVFFLFVCVIGVTGTILLKPIRWLSRIIQAEDAALQLAAATRNATYRL